MRPRNAVAIAALALSIAAGAYLLAQSEQPARIGWLLAQPSSSATTRNGVEIFMDAMRKLGYVEGGNLVVVYRYADQGMQQLPALAADLVKEKVDVIVTDGSQATRAAQQATKTIPIVMTVSAGPVAQGFVQSLSHPGGNITGLSMRIPELARKRLQYLKELVPDAKRVAVLRTAPPPGVPLPPMDLDATARELGVELIPLVAQGSNPDYERLFDDAVRARADALLVEPDALLARDRARIVELAAKRRLPAMYFERMFRDAGGLMSYGPDVPGMFGTSAEYVDKILKGAKPGDLPVQEVATFDFVINLQTAKALGLEIPRSLQMYAVP